VRAVIILILLYGAAHAQTLPDSPSSTRDDFFDRQNMALLASLTTWQALDAYETDRTLGEGGVERFPIARHFCQSRERRIGYFWAGYAATIGSSYLLHRTGHRKLEKVVLVLGNMSAASGYWFTIAHKR
jgi:hypothetical protein